MGRCDGRYQALENNIGPNRGKGTKKHTFETDERSKIMDNHVELPALKTGHQTTFRSGKTNK